MGDSSANTSEPMDTGRTGRETTPGRTNTPGEPSSAKTTPVPRPKNNPNHPKNMSSADMDKLLSPASSSSRCDAPSESILETDSQKSSTSSDSSSSDSDSDSSSSSATTSQSDTPENKKKMKKAIARMIEKKYRKKLKKKQEKKMAKKTQAKHKTEKSRKAPVTTSESSAKPATAATIPATPEPENIEMTEPINPSELVPLVTQDYIAVRERRLATYEVGNIFGGETSVAPSGSFRNDDDNRPTLTKEFFNPATCTHIS